MFRTLPPSIITCLLDSCVWSDIAESESATRAFITHFEENNLLAGLTVYTLFELSKVTPLLPALDSLFLRAGHNIWIALLYDELLLREVKCYPNPPSLPWMPMSMICDKKQPNVMSLFASNPHFRQKRDEHLWMGNTDFMALERFKANYPPQENGNYSPSQAREFAWMNTVDFLGRHFPSFLLQFQHDASALDTSRIPSVQMRSLLLFYKYYIHYQTPGASDFLDFANVSYVPYVDAYVTEKNVLHVLRRIKNSNLMLRNTGVIHVTEFVSQFRP